MRIIEIPEDETVVLNRDPRTGFIAYVPTGSIAKGEALVTLGGGGKTIACPICHGADLHRARRRCRRSGRRGQAISFASSGTSRTATVAAPRPRR